MSLEDTRNQNLPDFILLQSLLNLSLVTSSSKTPSSSSDILSTMLGISVLASSGDSQHKLPGEDQRKAEP